MESLKAPVWARFCLQYIPIHCSISSKTIYLIFTACYADDTQLYVSFSPKDELGQDDALAAMERCVEEIRRWMIRNRLMMNNDETEFLLIGTNSNSLKLILIL